MCQLITYQRICAVRVVAAKAKLQEITRRVGVHEILERLCQDHRHVGFVYVLVAEVPRVLLLQRIQTFQSVSFFILYLEFF